MKPKRIEIDFTIPIEEWADENRGVIMDSIYSNVFDFLESKDDDRIILQIIPILTKKSRMQRPTEPPVKVDFIISKEDIERGPDLVHVVRDEAHIALRAQASATIATTVMRFSAAP